ncbi:BadM/Rrf2 family transcriptional regulator [Arcticibacter tournemirensis]|uniref:Rrf2 family transcriptional regulator n=1 Tax=Arcticibacter tournemirensis TaxID=699437 RepID=A0A4Q0MB01_9SPHI|nr:Rrf2 family transcriptional regulator [Arcticibacter tournemirensis]KAA8484967.1 Rrf2 family transcriptional regulator [Arcticibacter tournemirensis]RXF70458.1 Rrf2 family transcriptional regulator [Arcticibacter tournemirensis]TQM50590.1 BadM/Rrf2 family transcriptional regulator [Arcticibacter tournemirensis]
MILSKSCEYAIRATVYIAFRSYKNEKAGIIEIAEAIGSPMHFTGKILQELSRKKVLSSNKGPNGGFYIADPSSLYLIDIIRAIDGNELFSSCVLGLKNCSDIQPCPVHSQIKPIRTQLLIEFSKKSVYEMVQEYERNKYFLK